ncbi:predicted protein [Streptomyces viridosporus ATCC 14672]|uniref:Predicted protein n=1 Tax=Streptomyces viridosporus (strain ATCC 14672 / DSM 40746 / JCM 4963 / KCTC 9882 / NRRL B-12104 / FH 1290) TaxID=566461 RepID=D5ZXT3_STRV1|nr:predicted protein [Streptomyces viridosporus ATCC 14672]
MASGHDRKHVIDRMTKTIRTSEIYLSSSLKRTFSMKRDVN